MQLLFAYITTPNKEHALAIGRKLVEERLAACINIVDGMQSVYWWQGEISEDNETILIAKTRESLLEKLIQRVKELHEYTCPCIVTFPIVGGNKDYLKWLEEETE